jgi:hypothetical protein
MKKKKGEREREREREGERERDEKVVTQEMIHLNFIFFFTP